MLSTLLAILFIVKLKLTRNTYIYSVYSIFIYLSKVLTSALSIINDLHVLFIRRWSIILLDVILGYYLQTSLFEKLTLSHSSQYSRFVLVYFFYDKNLILMFKNMKIHFNSILALHICAYLKYLAVSLRLSDDLRLVYTIFSAWHQIDLDLQHLLAIRIL